MGYRDFLIMKQLIMALTFILGSHAGFAHMSLAANKQSCSSIQGSNLIADHEMMGQKGVDLFGSILKKSEMYAFLLALDSNVPQIAKQLEYVALLNEAHLANQTLSQMVEALQKNNQLLEHHIHKGGAVDG